MANLHQAEANVKIKQGALDKAKADLDHCTITSPIDGVVISRSVDVGQTVAASLQAPVIFQIANDLAKMQIDSNVAEADVGVVQVGQDVDFTVDAFPTQTFHGKVVQVRNATLTVQNVVTYDTVIGVSNPDLKLKPGMTANVPIILARKDDVLQLKNAALRYRPAEAGPPSSQNTASQGGSRPPGTMRQSMGRREQKTSERTVYVLSSSRLTPVQIKTGISDGVVTEVIEGLKEGDLVVTAEMAAKSQPASTSANPFSAGPRRMPRVAMAKSVSCFIILICSRAHLRARMPSCRSSTARSIYRTRRFANEQITCLHRLGLPGARTITQVSSPAASNSASP